MVYLQLRFHLVGRLNAERTLKCGLCDHETQGETFEDWMQALMPHYMEAHADVMNNSDHTAEDKDKWMTENKARFDMA